MAEIGKNPRPAVCVVLCALALLIAGASNAGPVLDNVLNPMFKDQSVPMGAYGLAFQPNRTIMLASDRSVGQVFVAGLEADRLVRVWTYLPCNISWQPGEGAKMTIYEAPDRQTALGDYTVWYDFRGFSWSTAEFFFDIPLKPGKAYFMELTYTGTGDGVVCPVGVMNGSSNYDIMSNVIYVNPNGATGGDGRSWATAFNTIQAAIDARDNLQAGQGYLNGSVSDFDLCFQTHVKRAPNRIGNLKKMFARFDLMRPDLAKVKEAVGMEDYELAISRMIEHFNKRTVPTQLVFDTKIPVDYGSRLAQILERGENALQNRFFGDTGYGYVGPDINWRPHVDFDENGYPKASGFTMNRWGPRGALADAYLATADERYAKKLNDLLIDYFLDNPTPMVSGIGGASSDDVWASLNTGIRLAQKMTAYNRIHMSPNFTNDCRLAYILSLADHADTLIAIGVGAGGNWSVTQNTSLMEHALDFPEFGRSQFWFNAAADRIDNTIKTDFLPEGIENESAPGYQRWMVYNPLVSVHQLLLDRNINTAFSANLKATLEKFAEYFMYLYMPNVSDTQDNATPEFGDWGQAAPHFLHSDAALYDRADMKYVITRGAEGTKPAKLFKLYPNFGTVTMRSHWGDTGEPYDQARYLFFHGVNIGGHGHNDLNSVTAYAYGRELLTDPGSYTYGSPEHNWLCTSYAHNLMTVDGQDMGGGWAPFHNYCDTPVADHVAYRRPNAYSTGDYKREVFFIRTGGIPGAQDYWIVRDTASGSGTHTMEQRWHFNPTTMTVDGMTAKTGFPSGGNLALMQLTPSRLTLEQSTINSWRPRGNNEPPVDLPTFIYKCNGAFPAAIDTVLFPYNGPTMPAMTMTPIETAADGRNSVFKMVQGDISDLFALQSAAGIKTIASENVSFDAEHVFVRRVNGVVRAVLLIKGKQLTVNGTEIVNLPSRAAWYAISFDEYGSPTVYSASSGSSPNDPVRGPSIPKPAQPVKNIILRPGK